MSERPTPETDSNECAHKFLEQYGYECGLQDSPVGWADFARRLERERDTERALADQLREIFPKILDALGNGSGCTPEVSLEFLQGIPKEVELVVKHLKHESSYSEKERIDIAKELESEKKMHAETQNKLDRALEQWQLSSACRIFREQRDRLAEALREACAYPTTGNWYRQAQDALAALEEARNEI